MTESMNDLRRLADREADASAREEVEPAGSGKSGSPAPDYLSPKGFRLIPLLVPLAALTLLIGGMVILSTAGA